MYADFLDSFCGATGFFQCNDAKLLFPVCSAISCLLLPCFINHKVDLVMLSMQNKEVHGVIIDSLFIFYFHPALNSPRFVKEC